MNSSTRTPIDNTLGLPCYSENVFTINRIQDCYKLADSLNLGDAYACIGEGSNCILTELPNTQLVLMRNKGVYCLSETEDTIEFEVEAGENWHEFVQYSVNNEWSGVENLAFIPGSVGAAPVQNIGAYGVEFKDVCISVRVFDPYTRKFMRIPKDACGFAYRDSVFKRAHCDWIIVSVQIVLSKKTKLNLTYGELSRLNQEHSLSLEDVFHRIGDIRWSKLPKPSVLGNAGSFFKNPMLSTFAFDNNPLLVDVPCYKVDDDFVKISCAYLLDQLGYKGYREHAFGFYEKHALVLVHFGGGSLDELSLFIDKVQKDVCKHFGVSIEPEPVLIK